MLRCKKCNNKIGWIWYDKCSPRGYMEFACGDIFEVRCWWCGISYWYGSWREGSKPNEGDQCVIDDSMRDLLNLRLIGMNEYDLEGIGHGVPTK